MKVDERIAPQELIVGVNGHLCYVTYEETKGKKTQLNSEHSWEGWRDKKIEPLRVQNEFKSGFRLAGVNGRWSRNARNSDNLLIEHPLFGYCFELDLSRFLELIKDCTIENGVIQKELIMDKKRNLLSRDEYNKLVKKHNKIDAEEIKKQASLKSSKMSSKDQKVGHKYKDSKTGTIFLYMGTVDIESGKEFHSGEVHKSQKKHVYFEQDEDMTSEYQTVKAINWGDDIPLLATEIFPSIVKAYGVTGNDRKTPSFSTSTVWGLSIVKTKKPMSLLEDNGSDKDWLEKYTDDDWKIIEDTYKFIPGKNKWYNNEQWTKSSFPHKINFRKDYEEQK